MTRQYSYQCNLTSQFQVFCNIRVALLVFFFRCNSDFKVPQFWTIRHTNMLKSFQKIQLVLSTLMHLVYASDYALFTVSWWRSIAFVSGVGALRFKSWAGQLNTMLSMAHHHFDISSKRVVLLGCNDVEMGPTN